MSDPGKTVEDGLEPDATGASPAAGVSIGRFVTEGLLGTGGMGVVLAAFDPELGRRVAIKVLHARAASRGGEGPDASRLQREAQAMARLSHPNVVAVYEVGRIGDGTFIAMELVEGTTLREWLRTPRSWPAVVAMFVAAGRGLVAAHEAGLVHRDFKPDNVLVGRDGRARVGDFGLVASDVLARAAATTGLAGTPTYMSPETWAGGEVDARSDQFSFCVALWEALWGELPPVARASSEPRAAGAPAAHGRVPRRIRAALERGLSLEPAARWPKLVELLDTLEAATHRSRARALTAAVVALAAVAAGWAAWSLSRAPSPWRPELRRHLPVYEENADHAAISPDGTMLAYSSDRERQNVFRAYVAPLHGGPSRPASPFGMSVGSVRWAADGAAVLGVDLDHVAWRFPLDGAAPTRLGQPVRAVADCGGRTVLAYRSSPGCPTCGRIVAIGPEERELVRFLPGTEAWQIGCDRAGRRLVYVRFVGDMTSQIRGRTDVWLLELAGGAPRPLTSDGRGNNYPVLHPDGRSVVFSSSRGERTNLWELSLAGGEPVQLTFGDGDDLASSISPDGKLLVFNEDRTSTPLFVYDGSGRRRIATPRAALFKLEIAPDGEEAIAHSRVGLRDQIVAIALPDGGERDLAEGLEPALAGTEVAYVDAQRRSRVLAVARSGGTPRLVTTVDGTVVRLAAGGDGLLHLGIARDAGIFAEAVPLAGGSPSQEAPPSWCQIVPAPVGGWRAAVQCGPAGLTVRLVAPGAALDDASARTVEAQRFAWDHDGRSLVFDDYRVIRRIEVATGTETVLVESPLAAALAPAPLGRLYVAEKVAHVDRYLVVNFAERPWAANRR